MKQIGTVLLLAAFIGISFSSIAFHKKSHEELDHEFWEHVHPRKLSNHVVVLIKEPTDPLVLEAKFRAFAIDPLIKFTGNLFGSNVLLFETSKCPSDRTMSKEDMRTLVQLMRTVPNVRNVHVDLVNPDAVDNSMIMPGATPNMEKDEL